MSPLSLKFFLSSFCSDARLVSFRKSCSLGIQVSGGNMAGIFVAAVKEGSPAYNSGLRRGDQILMVSNQTSLFTSNTHRLDIFSIKTMWFSTG